MLDRVKKMNKKSEVLKQVMARNIYVCSVYSLQFSAFHKKTVSTYPCQLSCSVIQAILWLVLCPQYVALEIINTCIATPWPHL